MSSHLGVPPPSSPLSSPPSSPNLPTIPSLPDPRPVVIRKKYQSNAQNASRLPDPSADRRELGNDSQPYLIGPVELDDFFLKCFPAAQAPYAGKTPPRRFAAELRKVFNTDCIPLDASEPLMYDPLVTAMTKACSLMAGEEASTLSIRNRSNYRAEQDGRETAVDMAVFAHDAPEDAPWVFADTFIEVKKDPKDDPFVGDGLQDHKDRSTHLPTLTQFHDYACQMTKAKPRCFVFGIGIFGSLCRFFCWDRSASVASKHFDYIDKPEILADFLVRLDHVGQAGRGVDISATLPVTSKSEVLLVEDACREALHRGIVDHLPDATVATRIFVPRATGSEEQELFLSIGPPVFRPKSLFGRGTRTWLAVRAEADDLEFVVLKDAWREEGWRSEGEIYDEIYGRKEGCPDSGTFPFGVARMDRDVDLGNDTDDPHHQTRVPDFDKGKYIKRTHHRAILLSVGIPLHRFSSTRQLIEAIRDAIIGHKNMVEAGLIHRDVSVNNILISANPKDEQGAKGFMIDPEFAFSKEDRPDEGCGITGTLQFISINRMTNPDLAHEVWHDLESYYWVTLFLVLRHTTTNRGLDIIPGLFDEGCTARLAYINRCSLPRSPSTVEVMGHVPLTKLLRDLVILVRSHYKPEEDVELFRVSDPSRLDQLTHSNVLKALDTALSTEGWPTHDAAAIFKLCLPQSKQDAVAALQDLQQRNERSRHSQQVLVAGDKDNRPSVQGHSRRSKRKIVEVEGENAPPPASERTGKTSASTTKKRR
ncbi:hypothetical protein JAAARDRAFT_199278 [Jaapia argillacea MUCL 33604]|uniref:Fungal-type protein kinase domain-containing protein n=1 Tax=Jaapia argillacea MUCL 33604 TaxID=933084 RepID=A0A067PLA9_9AGAM|nr:hypothetical protein JAAARDRAFT_199278 [Jaapia argillacea MUCL 33604]